MDTTVLKIPVLDKQENLLCYNVRAERLSYRISCGGGSSTRQILNEVTCEARPGELLAIAGPSGAGKTSLLEILAGMVPLRQLSGRVMVNGQPMDVKCFRRVSGYVTQDDALFPLLTVEETLMYSALLRRRGGRAAAQARVKELLRELGLEGIASSRIGDDGEGRHRGVSGGEKRRVSIGVEAVHDPAVLLLDEPTSGLDSASALQVLSLLKNMAAQQGKTIVMTIHQPGFRLLELFDQILLLSEGSVLHQGSLQALETHLESAGHCIPRHVNVLEFAIETLDSLLTIESDDHLYLQRHEKEHQHEHVHAVKMPFSYANSRREEVRILAQRFCSNVLRTKQLFAARTLQSLVVGLVLGSIFMEAGTDGGRAALQARVGFFAFSLTFLLSSTTEGLPIFLQERRILMRETSRGAYRVSSYAMSNALVFLPFLFMVALLYAIPVYWQVGLRRQIDGFLYFSLVVWMVLLMANSFVACFSALVSNFIMGNSLIAGFMGSFFLFSGYFISEKSIPRYWIFMHYLSLFKYPFEAFIINEYGGRQRGRCLQFGPAGACIFDGEEFLRQQGLKEVQKWRNLGVMLGFILGYRVLSFLVLWFRCCRMRK